MHPTGIEPALKASEAFVLSIRLRVHAVINVTILLQRLHHTIPFFICPVRSLIVSDFCRIFFCLYHLTEPDPEGNYPFPGISLPKCSNRILTTKSFACLFPFGFRLPVPVQTSACLFPSDSFCHYQSSRLSFKIVYLIRKHILACHLSCVNLSDHRFICRSLCFSFYRNCN